VASAPVRRQIEVYRFSAAVSVGIPLAAVLFQGKISLGFPWLAAIDLPLLVTIFFALARRSQVAGLLTGGSIGLFQDALTDLPIGINGIAKTVIGYAASSVGAKIDVENPGSRLLMTLVFYLMHQAIYFLVARGMMGRPIPLLLPRLLLTGLANALVAVFLFGFLDRFKKAA
jgi:rod shape-determining protein MreD